MKAFLVKLAGVNYKTTLAAIGMIIAVITKIGLAYRTKDIEAILSNGQELVVDIGLLAGAIGLLKAKDSNTVGAGDKAKSVASDGTVTKADGTVTDPTGHPLK